MFHPKLCNSSSFFGTPPRKLLPSADLLPNSSLLPVTIGSVSLGFLGGMEWEVPRYQFMDTKDVC